MTNIKNVLKLSERELKTESKSSWHDMYRGSAWIFVGGLPYVLTEGDVLSVFSQYGEIVNINLIRDKITGKQKGFCFICFEDQRSTILSVDNLNGIKILGRTIRVDHVSDYKPPKSNDKTDEDTLRLQLEGCAPKPQMNPAQIKKEPSVSDDIALPPRLPIDRVIKKEEDMTKIKSKIQKKSKKIKKRKKEKKKKSKSHKKRRSSSSSESSDSDSRK